MPPADYLMRQSTITHFDTLLRGQTSAMFKHSSYQVPACYKVECASFCGAGCDHRGASSDHRMLKLLQDVLGLEQALPKEESSRLAAWKAVESSRCSIQASRSWEWFADSCMLGVCGKLGCRSLDFAMWDVFHGGNVVVNSTV